MHLYLHILFIWASLLSTCMSLHYVHACIAPEGQKRASNTLGWSYNPMNKSCFYVHGTDDWTQCLLFCFVLWWFLRWSCSLSPWLSQNSLCRPTWPPTHRYLPASTFWVLGLRARTMSSKLRILYVLGKHSTSKLQEAFLLREIGSCYVSQAGLEFTMPQCLTNPITSTHS